ncbi:MAG: hypothetical protein UW61_C0008G0012 [Candidatus Curtissbacteria bacterium GW2011_GWC1_44_33]|uniref:Uncharacterized protein n=1 Tax=Candidatus Curtissbacteria bacterium GW2011_GWC1_44_33 TaxID=1618413 RepID=A0A0G1M6D7_9BACT|nr:MAG: hypothetical protein UW61_C0008G0012 [Candidatus Curtissbacteria bacterium GW2011_GWC1_44_33]
MSGELEKALERYRQKKQKDHQLTEQQRAAEQARITSDFERIVSPVLQKFWSKNVPQELVELFDTFAQQVAKKIGLKKPLPQIGYLFGGFLYEEPKDEPPEITIKEKGRVLQIINETGMENLEILTRYELFEQGSGRGGSAHLSFGFRVISKNPSIVHWWTGGGDAEKISGDYIRTQESLENTADGLARALEENIFYYSAPISGPD